jgi:translation initiation factor 2 beta subunit (eIF-2beta)/eIF-5
MKEHVKTLEKFLERGYRIDDQDEAEEIGLHGEKLNSTLITILRPPSTILPMIKFEAKQIFGTYNYDKETYTPWDEPKFVVKMLKKSADIKAFNAPWQPFDLPE